MGVEAAYEDGRGTTISTTEDRYPNHYDHIFLQEGTSLSVTDQGILRFPERWGINHEVARDAISDHVPVWIALNGASLRLPDDATVVASSKTNTCIDINSAPADELNDLPHVGESRATAIVDGRPWASFDALAAISGLSESRVEDIASSGLACDP